MILDSQNELLYKIVENEDYFLFGKLSKQLFYDDNLNNYLYIYNHLLKYQKLPSLQSFITDNNLPTVELSEPINYYIDKVIKSIIKKVYTKYIPDLNDATVKNDTVKLEETLNRLINEISQYKLDINDDIKDYVEILSNSFENSISNRDNIVRGIQTPYQSLNNLINGFKNKNVYSLVARLKQGKSMILCNMAHYIKNLNKNVTFISLEMSSDEIADRFLALEYNISKEIIAKSKLNSYLENKIRNDLPTKGKNLFLIDGKLNFTLESIHSYIKHTKCDILFIDGAYLLNTSLKYFKSRWEKVTFIIENLKLIAMSYDIPIVCSFQFNRSINKSSNLQDVGVENIGLSDAIAQISTSVLAIASNDISNTQKKIEVIANRDGLTGDFIINWDWDNMNFSEIEQQETSFSFME